LSNNRDKVSPTLVDEKPRKILAFCAAAERRNFAALRLPPQTWWFKVFIRTTPEKYTLASEPAVNPKQVRRSNH
jgi:hypothetical protein